MMIERNAINGSLVISAIIGDYLVSRVYYGYTRREAIALFRQDKHSAE